MMPVEKAILITRLDDALKLFDVKEWRDLRTVLVSGDEPAAEPGQSKKWYEANASLLAREKSVISRLMNPLPEYPGFFYVREDSKRLGAIGLVQVTGGKMVKLEIIFPDDYPDSPPRAFCFGPALGRLSGQLLPDGAIPVPFGPEQQWTPNANSGHIISWAVEWIERFIRTGTQDSAPSRRST